MFNLCVIVVGALVLESSVHASPWPIEASIA